MTMLFSGDARQHDLTLITEESRTGQGNLVEPKTVFTVCVSHLQRHVTPRRRSDDGMSSILVARQVWFIVDESPLLQLTRIQQRPR